MEEKEEIVGIKRKSWGKRGNRGGKRGNRGVNMGNRGKTLRKSVLKK